MPPRSPLPPRHGLSAAWKRTADRDPQGPPWPTMFAWLEHEMATHADVRQMMEDGRFVYDDLSPVRFGDPYTPHTFVWFHRDLREEVEVPGDLTFLHRDERLVVVDKPAFLSTIPRGRHVLQSVVVRLRAELDLPELTPVHRLDRVTSGVLVLATERRWRGPYQGLFQQRSVRKTYRALAPWQEALESPLIVRNHLRKDRGAVQAEVVPDAPVNAETLIEMESRAGDLAVFRLSPTTGRTHQLRRHLADLGSPIVGDPLYPRVTEASVDDFDRPLQLLASELAFTDPVDGVERCFASTRELPLHPETKKSRT